MPPTILAILKTKQLAIPSGEEDAEKLEFLNC